MKTTVPTKKGRNAEEKCSCRPLLPSGRGRQRRATAAVTDETE